MGEDEFESHSFAHNPPGMIPYTSNLTATKEQSLLPGQIVYLTLTHEQQVAEAITTLKVRGAPAIGVTTAFGMALALYCLLRERGEGLTVVEIQAHLQAVGEM